MAKPLPKKYFPGYTAKIYLRKVDKWAEMHAKSGIHPYFDSWEEAHGHMMDKAIKDVNQLTQRLASAKRHLAKVQLMKNIEKGII